MTETLCSFCRKAQREVRALVAGPGTLAICDECIRLCVDILDAEAPKKSVRAFEDQVIGHARAKEVVRSALRRAAIDGASGARILLVGPSGCGKSALLRALRDTADVPFSLMDVGTLSEPGYIGDGVEHVLEELMRSAAEDAARAGRGLVLLDGLGRISAARPLGVGRDIAGEGVQRALLPLLEGNTLDVRDATHPIQTRGVTIIAALTCDARAASEREMRESVRASGFLPAFIARFDRVVSLDMLSSDEMLLVLERMLAPIDVQLARIGSRMAIDRAALRSLADAASTEGAWRLHRTIERAIEDALLAPNGTFRPDLTS